MKIILLSIKYKEIKTAYGNEVPDPSSLMLSLSLNANINKSIVITKTILFLGNFGLECIHKILESFYCYKCTLIV